MDKEYGGTMLQKNKKFVFVVAALLILWFCIGAYSFVDGVQGQLWKSSIRTITESTHQGVNAFNIQLELDFDMLERIFRELETSEYPEHIVALYEELEEDVILYFDRFESTEKQEKYDYVVQAFLAENALERGLLNSHISSVTGEHVFNIFLKGTLLDGTQAYLVKEYSTKEIARQFTLTFYDNTGFSYLIDKSGSIVMRPIHRNSFKTIPNIFHIISEEENDQEAIARFRENLQTQESGWAKFYNEGKGLVFCYEVLREDASWLMVSIIPEHVITKQATSILKRTTFFTGSAFFMVFLVVAVIYGIKMHENEQHTKELTEALHVADEANRAKDKFLMDMSHDIRTPLNAIIGMTTIAQENVISQQKVEDCLYKIKRSSMHLLSMVSDLLDLSQLEYGKMILKEETISFAELYLESAELMSFKAKEKQVALKIALFVQEKEMVSGDSFRIRQILLNIISNAIKYTPSGGTVSLELTQLEEKREGKRVYCFCCTDTGIGMEQEFLERMFLPFERARNTTDSKIVGIGAGLTITKSLLELMGGEIFVESELGKGSQIKIELPMKVVEAAEEKTTDKNVCSEEEEAFDYAHRRVLLVEDNELNVEIMEELLSITNIQVEKASNGQEAVSMVSEKDIGYYDLIFMDIQMPVMDGYEATRQIRKMDRSDTKTLPIYAVSANALASDIQNAKDAGMDGHIAKPVDFDSIERVLKQYLS